MSFRHGINYNRDRDGGAHRHHRGWFLYLDLPDNPLCWLLGHRPFVYRLPLGRPRHDGQDEYRWIECRVCGRRSTRQVPPSPQAINYEGVAAGTERRSEWSGQRAEFKAETIVKRRLLPEFSIRFHLGSRGSETPVDVHLTVAGLGIYASTSLGSRFADRLTRGKGRDLSLNLHGGTLYWKLWIGEDNQTDNRRRWRTGKYRSWVGRDGSLSVKPLDYLYGGSPKFSYEEIDGPRSALLVTAEGTEHVVDLTLQRETLARPRGPRRTSWSVKWTCADGIPVRNHEWKGDCIYGSGVRVESIDEWVAAAIAAMREQVSRDRRHHDWQPPREPVQP